MSDYISILYTGVKLCIQGMNYGKNVNWAMSHMKALFPISATPIAAYFCIWTDSGLVVFSSMMKTSALPFLSANNTIRIVIAGGLEYLWNRHINPHKRLKYTQPGYIHTYSTDGTKWPVYIGIITPAESEKWNNKRTM